MNALLGFFNWLLQASWQAAVLILLVLLAQWLFKPWLSARGRAALWLLVLIRLALPTSPASVVSLFNYLKPGAPAPLAEWWQKGSPGKATPVLAAAGATRSAGTVQSLAESDRAFGPDAITDLPDATARLPLTLWTWAAGLWAFVGLLLGARLFWRNSRFARQLRRCQAVINPHLLDTLAECQAVMAVRSRLRLVATDLVPSPAVYGLFRRQLLLPVAMLDRLSRGEWRYVLLHELGHLKRRDVLVNWLMGLLRIMHWFNPLIWIAFCRIRQDRELACDELVLAKTQGQENQAYGQAIIRILENGGHSSSLPGLIGILETQTQIERRIKMIARFEKSPHRPVLVLVLLTALGLVTLTDARTNSGAGDGESPPATVKTSAAATIKPAGDGGQLITVSKTGKADFDSITNAYNQVVKRTGGTLTANWTIKVLDTSVYDESVNVNNLVTSAAARLTICSSDPYGNKPTIYPSQDAARPITVHGTDFVTIRGFIFKNNQVTSGEAMTGVNFTGHAPPDSQVMWDNCVWDGQGQTYPFKAGVFCWDPNCNITIQNSTFQNFVCGTNFSVFYLSFRTNIMASIPTFRFVNNTVIRCDKPGIQMGNRGVTGLGHKITIQKNTFEGNSGRFPLLLIYSENEANVIEFNKFIHNSLGGVQAGTITVGGCGHTEIRGNQFLENEAQAEIRLEANNSPRTRVSGPIKLTGNLIAPSAGGNYGIWAAFGPNAVLESSGNTFYSNHSQSAPWNEPNADYVAYWAGDQGQNLTISQWNEKTPSDGPDTLAPLGAAPSVP